METRYVTMCILNESCALAVTGLIRISPGRTAGRAWRFPRTL